MKISKIITGKKHHEKHGDKFYNKDQHPSRKMSEDIG